MNGGVAARSDATLIERIRAICLDFPEVTERPSHGTPTFFVRDKKAFAYAWIAGHPDVTVGIRSSTWSIPLPWFILFEPEERRQYQELLKGGMHPREALAAMGRSGE